MNILYLGGAGFIGSAFRQSIIDGTIKHPALESLTLASRRLHDTPPKRCKDNVQLSQCNMDVRFLYPEDLNDYDVVIHGATHSSHTKFASNEEVFDEIITTTRQICLACSIAKVPLVFLSSGAVYDKKSIGNKPFEETDPIVDENYSDPYARGKRAAEELALSFYKNTNIAVGIMRIFSVAGQNLPRNQHFAIGNFFEDARSGRNIVVKTTRKVFRSYIYQTDLCQQIIEMASHCVTTNRATIVNAGGEEALELRELARKIAAKFGVNVKSNDYMEGTVDDWYIPSMSLSRNLFPNFKAISIDEQISRIAAGTNLY